MSAPVLLDTNAWLRAFGWLGELNAAARALVTGPRRVPLHLSAISVWEVCTKFRRKPAELGLLTPLVSWLPIAFTPSLVRVLPLDADIARLSQELPGAFHEDPAIGSLSPRPVTSACACSPATKESSPTPTSRRLTPDDD